MSVGILQKEKTTVVEVKESSNSIVIEKSYLDDNGNFDYKNASIGLSLDDFIIKNLYLPNVSKKELQKTIDLQLEFNVPKHDTDYYTSYNTKAHKSGFLLFILAVKKTIEYKKAKAIIPAPVGLFAYAVHQKLFAKEENVLLIHVDGNAVTTITIHDGELVFMREFLMDTLGKVKQNIQLSSQAVYLQNDRHFIDLNKIIVIDSREDFKNIIEKSVEDKTEVQWIDSSEFNSADKGNLFLNVSQALFHPQNKAMAYWNVAEKPPGARESLKRILIFAIPVLVIFLPLYYYAGYYSKTSEMKSIQARIDQYNIQLGNVDLVSAKLERGKAYMEEIGGPILNFARINKLFNVINECRPDNLWVVSITGKLNGLFVINGLANSYKDITKFIKNLEASEFIENINLNYTNEASGQNVNYQLTLHLSDDNYFILDSKDKKDKKEILDSKPKAGLNSSSGVSVKTQTISQETNIPETKKNSKTSEEKTGKDTEVESGDIKSTGSNDSAKLDKKQPQGVVPDVPHKPENSSDASSKINTGQNIDGKTGNVPEMKKAQISQNKVTLDTDNSNNESAQKADNKNKDLTSKVNLVSDEERNNQVDSQIQQNSN